MLVTGAGQISMAIARRMGYGKKIVLGDRSIDNAKAIAKTLTEAAIGQKYQKSAAQVALRYLIQRDVIVIPKTVHKNRMEQNFDVFDFILTDDDMAEILKLDMGESQFFSHADPETVKMISSFKI